MKNILDLGPTFLIPTFLGHPVVQCITTSPTMSQGNDRGLPRMSASEPWTPSRRNQTMFFMGCIQSNQFNLRPVIESGMSQCDKRGF